MTEAELMRAYGVDPSTWADLPEGERTTVILTQLLELRRELDAMARYLHDTFPRTDPPAAVIPWAAAHELMLDGDTPELAA